MSIESTTGEIVEEITSQSTTRDIVVVLKMIVQYLESFTMDKMSRDVMSAAADRLEQQEQRIAELERDLATYKQTICPECHMPMGSDEKKCSECDVSWALEGEGK